MSQYLDIVFASMGAIAAIVSVLVVVAFVIRRVSWSASLATGPAQFRLHRIDAVIPSRASEGLILLVGSSASSGIAIVRFHLPDLQHCWIIERYDYPGTGSEIASRFENTSIQFHIGTPYSVEPNSAESTRRVVDRVLDKEVSMTELEWGDVIADVSGGTPPMVLGLAKACGDRVPLEYMESPTDLSGGTNETTEAIPIFLGWNLDKA
jgi:hypothetical protein